MIASVQEEIASFLEKAGGTWGCVIERLGTGERWTHLPDERFYAASLIKVPIMAAVFADVYRGKYAFETRIVLRQEDIVGGDGVLRHLSPGLSLSVCNLVTLMIIQSDNTATNMLIELTGVESVRAIMRQAGMENSQFYNKLMIVPAEPEGYNEVTAADMASILRKLATGQLLSRHSCAHMVAILKQQQIRHALPLHLPDPDHPVIGGQPLWELAHKTGSVTHIEHDAGILYAGGEAILIVVLSKNVPSQTARDTIGRIARLLYDRCVGK